MPLIITPLIIYLCGGLTLGWIGGRITAPDSGLIDWKPGQHASMMIQCKRLCEGHVLKYEPQTGDCVCRGVQK